MANSDVAAALIVVKRARGKAWLGPEDGENGLKNQANNKEENSDGGDDEEDGKQNQGQEQQEDDVAAAGADIGSEGFEVFPHDSRLYFGIWRDGLLPGRNLWVLRDIGTPARAECGGEIGRESGLIAERRGKQLIAQCVAIVR